MLGPIARGRGQKFLGGNEAVTADFISVGNEMGM